ncbi:MAG: hypothetical protein KatS3mg114_1274 [Planctomycetaceae bacterium]|nr:MAG: hypothetical protein KatS3mg114_1274 [Planctomycetaceae bacterium]
MNTWLVETPSFTNLSEPLATRHGAGEVRQHGLPSVAELESWQTAYEQDGWALPTQHPAVVQCEQPFWTTPHVGHWFQACQGTSSAVAVLVPKQIRLDRLGARGCRFTWHGWRLVGSDCLVTPRHTPNPQHDFTQSAVVDEATRWCVKQVVRKALDLVRDSQADFWLIEDLEVGSLLEQVLTEEVPADWCWLRPGGIQSRWRISLAGDPADYWRRFSSKTLSTLRRKRRKFGRTRLECFTRPEQVPNFLALAHHISRDTWQTRQFGLRIANNLREQRLYTTLAELGLLRSYIWFTEEQPAAFLVGLYNRQIYYYDEVGYVQSYAKYSPGQTMLVQVLEDLLSGERPAWFDFGGGHADYKAFFSTHASRSGTVWLIPPSLTRRLLTAYSQSVLWAGRWLRRQVHAGHLETRLRHMFRYGRGLTGYLARRSSSQTPPPCADPGDAS